MKKSHLSRIIPLFLSVILVGGYIYMISVKFDIPFRVSGSFENGTTHGTLSVSPDGRTIVYDSPKTGHGDLYLVKSDGSNIRRLTSDLEYEGTPAFSPDGAQIAFAREDHYCGHIWIMNTDGSGQRQITHGSDYDSDPCFTPDGKQIWFGRMPRGTRMISVYSISLNGEDLVPVQINGKHIIPEVSFVRKGDWVYYEHHDSDWEIWASHLDGTSNHRIGSGRKNAVSSDGKKIAFAGGPYLAGLWVMNVDGSHRKKLYQYQDYQIYCIRFSPDGRYIYFRIGGTWGDIFRIEADGSSPAE